METKGSVLVIDDEDVMRDVLKILLSEAGYHVRATSTATEGLEEVRSGTFDVVLLDLMMPEIDGFQVLEEIRKIDPGLVTIIITAYASIEKAFQASKLGAFDFVAKPFKNDEVLLKVKNGIQNRKLLLENTQLKKSFRERFTFQNLVGKSNKMQKVYNLITQISSSRSTVLISGESGTGKELVAKAIHNCSPRADSPFVIVNCSNIPSELLESELFGHVKGAFTGASSTKRGLFEIADTGSIFLDELGVISTEIQSKLLRVIQEREFRRLGGIESIKVDVRIIAATNLDLQMAVQENKFREDLFYRLNVISIKLPSLRERKEDIPLLVEHFIKKYCVENNRSMCTIDSDSLRVLMDYDWPGNIRELENVIEGAVVMTGDSNTITQDILPRDLKTKISHTLPNTIIPEDGLPLKDKLVELERQIILAALEKTDWNQKKAAGLLHLNPTTLNEKLKRLKIRNGNR